MNKSTVLSMIAKLVCSAVILFVLAFLGLFALVLLSFSRLEEWLTYSFAAVVLVLAATIVALIWKPSLIRRGWIPAVAVLGVWLVAFGVNAAALAYDDSIPELSDRGTNLQDYIPFQAEARLARLGGPSTFALSGELPRLDCATALYPVAAAFVEAVYPEGEYHPYKDDGVFHQTDTATAYQRLAQGEVDLIFAAGPSGGQLDSMKAAGVELVLTPIGREAFVFFVNARNPVEELSVEQIQGVYSGRVTRWSELGGGNDPIRAFQRPKDSGSQTALENIMGDTPLMAAPQMDVVDFMGGMIDKTADYKNYKNAIGYSFRYFSTEMVRSDEIKLLRINGVYPDKDSIHDGEYPFSSEFYAVTVGEPARNTRELIDWILSPQGQYLIEETGYVSLS